MTLAELVEPNATTTATTTATTRATTTATTAATGAVSTRAWLAEAPDAVCRCVQQGGKTPPSGAAQSLEEHLEEMRRELRFYIYPVDLHCKHHVLLVFFQHLGFREAF